MRLYLAHPLDDRKWIRQWELNIEAQTHIDFLNPFYDVERPDIVAIDAGIQKKYQSDPNVVVNRDLLNIQKSDGLAAFITGTFSVGTIMEIVYAHRDGKTIYLMVSNGHHNHPWLRYHSTKIFQTVDDITKFLLKLSPISNSGEH